MGLERWSVRWVRLDFRGVLFLHNIDAFLIQSQASKILLKFFWSTDFAAAIFWASGLVGEEPQQMREEILRTSIALLAA